MAATLGIVVLTIGPTLVTEAVGVAAAQEAHLTSLGGPNKPSQTRYLRNRWPLIGGTLCAGGIPPEEVGSRRAMVRLSQLRTGAHWLRRRQGERDKLDRAVRTCMLQRRGG